MLEALVTGAQRPAVVAEGARGRAARQASSPGFPSCARPWRGGCRPSTACCWATCARISTLHLDFLAERLAQLHRASETALVPLADAVALRQTIPCVGRITATGMVAESGVAMRLLCGC
jgi:hypothetical protein